MALCDWPTTLQLTISISFFKKIKNNLKFKKKKRIPKNIVPFFYIFVDFLTKFYPKIIYKFTHYNPNPNNPKSNKLSYDKNSLKLVVNNLKIFYFKTLFELLEANKKCLAQPQKCFWLLFFFFLLFIAIFYVYILLIKIIFRPKQSGWTNNVQ